MALTERVVLFHDFGPAGHERAPRSATAGSAGSRASSRCRTRAAGCASTTARDAPSMARRSPPRTASLLDDGTRVELGADGRLPATARIVTADGSVVPARRSRRTASGIVARRPSASWPSTGCASAPARRRRDRPVPRPATGRPIIEGERATFLCRGDADEVWVRHRVVGLPDPLRLRRIPDTDLWYVTIELPGGSRVEYQLEIRRGDARSEPLQRPAQPQARAQSGRRELGLRRRRATRCPTGRSTTRRPGRASSSSGPCRARRCAASCTVTLYLPARFQRGRRATRCSSCTTAPTTSIRLRQDRAGQPDPPPRRAPRWSSPSCSPRDRLVEYANHAPHARFIARELVPAAEPELPLASTARRVAACMGSSFGGVAVALDRGALPRRVRLAAAAVGVARASPTSAPSTAAARPSTRW